MTLMTIGEFARASGLTPKALRLYDELGLLVPAEVDPHSGYRRYEPDQLGPARLVATLRLVGMPLARIRSVLAQPPPTAAAEVASYWRQVEADIASRRQIVRDLVRQLDEEESTMHITEQAYDTHVGVRHRQGDRDQQLDAVLTTSDTFAVADGFGSRDDLPREALERFVAEGYAAAAAAVAARAGDGDGTTLTALTLVDGEARITHVGDARVQLVRDGEVRRLTSDHTLVAGLIESGDLTEDEAWSHPDRLLLNRALSADAEHAEPDETTCPVRAGDRLVLTTDGVHATLPADALQALLTAAGDPESVAAGVATAVERAGAPDNHTVVVVDLVAAG